MGKECRGDYFLEGHLVKSCSQFPEDTLQTSVYEVFRIIDRKPLFIEDHIERFLHSIELSGSKAIFTRRQILDDILNLIRENRITVGNIKLLFRENADPCNRFLAYFIPHQYPDARQFSEGVETLTLNALRNNPNAKVFDPVLRSTTDLMKSEKQVYEVLLVDDDQCITEGSRSNVFFIRDGVIRTPAATDVLEGVTRKHVIKVILKKGLPFIEEKVKLLDALRSEAAFLTGTSRKVLPIKKIDNTVIPTDHLLLRDVMEAFETEIASYLRS